jgi:hypothetical protein
MSGLGNIIYGTPPGAGGSGAATVTGADSGTSLVAKNVVLGNQVGSTTSAALLSNAAIPLAGFNIAFTQIGGAAASVPTSNIILQDGASILLSSPQITIQNSAGTEIGRVNFTNDNSIFIGTLSGAVYTGGAGVNTALGALALSSLTSGNRNTAVGFAALGGATTSSFNVAVGQEALSSLTTAAGGNVAVGQNALLNITTGSFNIGIGIDAGDVLGTASSNNTMIGGTTGGATGAALNVNNNTFVGCFIFETSPSYGNGNTIIGTNNFVASGQTIGSTNIVMGLANVSTLGAIGNNNIIIGNGVSFSTIVVTNSIVLNTGVAAFNLAISNVVCIGSNTQNTLIGPATGPADNGSRLQINGTVRTGGAAPLTLGSGSWDMGNVVAAASVLNAAKYLEVSVGGVLVKVCIN